MSGARDGRLLSRLTGVGSPRAWSVAVRKAGGLDALRRRGPVGLDLPVDRMARVRLQAAIGLHERWVALEAQTPPRRVGDPEDVVEILGARRRRRAVECFWTLALDARSGLLGLVEVARGTVSACLVHPREVFAPAIQLRASSVVVAHNHPTGDPTPSLEDRDLTRRLAEAGDLLGIPLVDHVVVGAQGYRSLLAPDSSDPG